MITEHEISKQDIARSFGLAAQSYDSVALLQRDIGRCLLSFTPLENYSRILDLGSGTGYFSAQLLHQFNADSVVGIDIAEGMVKFANETVLQPGLSWCCGDAESLPFADESISMVFSNLALQWCTNLRAALQEAMRVLKPGGCFVFSTLGPDTLFELKSAWGEVDQYTHVNQFLDAKEIGIALDEVGFSYQFNEEVRVMEYQHLRELTHELKALGAHNLNSGRSNGLTGKQRIQRFLTAYEGFRNSQGRLPATYQTYYFVLHKRALCF